MILTDDEPEYSLFVFHNIFAGIPKLPITNLKIYFHKFNTFDFEANPDAYCICSPYAQSKYNIEEYPLFKSIGTVIDTMTIVISDFPNKDHILNSLAHEMKHAVSLICDDKLYLRVDRDNKVSEKFYKMMDFLRQKQLSINSPFDAKRWWIVYEWFAQLSYYAQPTEMESHLESAYYEVMQSKYSKDEILKYLRQPLTPTNPLAKVSQTLCNYITLRDILDILLKPEYLEAMKQPHNKQHADIIVKIFYNNDIPKNAKLKSIFRKWQIVIEKFLTQICQVLSE